VSILKKEWRREGRGHPKWDPPRELIPVIISERLLLIGNVKQGLFQVGFRAEPLVEGGERVIQRKKTFDYEWGEEWLNRLGKMKTEAIRMMLWAVFTSRNSHE
jgi:hypothetical protein